jgi:hypothetical protein
MDDQCRTGSLQLAAVEVTSAHRVECNAVMQSSALDALMPLKAGRVAAKRGPMTTTLAEA